MDPVSIVEVRVDNTNRCIRLVTQITNGGPGIGGNIVVRNIARLPKLIGLSRNDQQATSVGNGRG